MRRGLLILLLLVPSLGQGANEFSMPKHLTSGLRYTVLAEADLPWWRRAKDAVDLYRGVPRAAAELPVNEAVLAAVAMWAVRHHAMRLVPEDFSAHFGTPALAGNFIKFALLRYLDPYQIYFIDSEVHKFLADGNPAEVFEKFKAGDWSALYKVAHVYTVARTRFRQAAYDPAVSEDVESAAALIERYATQLKDSALPKRRAQHLNGLRARVIVDVARRIGVIPTDPDELRAKVREALMAQQDYVRRGDGIFDSSPMRTVFAAFINGLDPDSHFYQANGRRNGRMAAAPYTIEEFMGRRVAYIRPQTLSSPAFRLTVAELQDKKVEGMILDLRGTHGGRTADAMHIAALLAAGHVSFAFQSLRPGLFGARPEVLVSPEQRWHSMKFERPILVLADQGTRGPAEILISSLSDYNRVLVLGASRTFGSGLAQSSIHLRSLRFIGPDRRLLQVAEKERGEVILSDSFVLTVDGTQLQHEGVKPDLVLLTDARTRRPAPRLRLNQPPVTPRPVNSGDLWISDATRLRLKSAVAARLGDYVPVSPRDEDSIRTAVFEAMDELIRELEADFKPDWVERKPTLFERCEEFLSTRLSLHI